MSIEDIIPTFNELQNDLGAALCNLLPRCAALPDRIIGALNHGDELTPASLAELRYISDNAQDCIALINKCREMEEHEQANIRAAKEELSELRS